MKKLRYIKLDHTNPSDGAAIYDRNFLAALREIGFDVQVVSLKRNRGLVVPFWLAPLNGDKVISDLSCKKEDVFTIVSHESLAGVLEVVECDLFIIHNVFSIFKFKGRPDVDLLYRLGGLSVYENIILKSRFCVCLSFREFKFLSGLSKDIGSSTRVVCEPPGIFYTEKFHAFDCAAVKISGTSSWLPKRLSRLGKSEYRSLADAFEISNDDLSKVPSFSLIDEKFLSGFKLKLIQMLYRGDCIASFVDLEEEILHLGVDRYCFSRVDSIEEAIGFFKNESEWRGAGVRNKKWFEDKFSWIAIVGRIVFLTGASDAERVNLNETLR